MPGVLLSGCHVLIQQQEKLAISVICPLIQMWLAVFMFIQNKLIWMASRCHSIVLRSTDQIRRRRSLQRTSAMLIYQANKREFGVYVVQTALRTSRQDHGAGVSEYGRCTEQTEQVGC